ncbi:MAG: hypothetical protein H7832_04650 [Magnetococcus sp. DMHC-6]
MIRNYWLILFVAIFVSILFLNKPKEVMAAPVRSVEELQVEANQELDVMLTRIDDYYQEVSHTLTSALDLDVFKEYFSLLESKTNVYNELAEIEFTDRQNELRQKMADWVILVHKRILIGEVCLIDRMGQEHFRFVNGRIEPTYLFSDQERDAPFFYPSLALNKGDFYQSEPYISPDSYDWVTAFTSILVLSDGTKPAFLHFEVPLSIYEVFIKKLPVGSPRQVAEEKFDMKEVGRYFIVDQQGFVLADSQTPKDAKTHEKRKEILDFRHQEKLMDYFPSAQTISDDSYFLRAVEQMKKGETGVVHLEWAGQNYIFVFKPIQNRNWSLGYLDPVDGVVFGTK